MKQDVDKTPGKASTWAPTSSATPSGGQAASLLSPRSPNSPMNSQSLQVEVGPPMATQEGAVYVLGKEVDMRTRNIIYALTLTSPVHAWTIEKSFGEYEALNDALKTRHSALPEFPRKRHITHFLKFTEKSDYWNAIRDGLQTYFAALLADETFRQDPDLQTFLKPPIEGTAPLLVTLEEPQKYGDAFEYPVTISNSHLKSRHKLEWTVTRQHDDFVAFHERMKNRYPDKELPAFPRKRRISQLLRYGSEDEWYKVQSVEIENYLNAILSDDRILGGAAIEDPCMKDLLDINESKLKIATRSARSQSQGSSFAASSSMKSSFGPSSMQGAGPMLTRSNSEPGARTVSAGIGELLERTGSPQIGYVGDSVVFTAADDQSCGHVRSRLQGCINLFRGEERPVQSPEWFVASPD